MPIKTKTLPLGASAQRWVKVDEEVSNLLGRKWTVLDKLRGYNPIDADSNRTQTAIRQLDRDNNVRLPKVMEQVLVKPETPKTWYGRKYPTHFHGPKANVVVSGREKQFIDQARAHPFEPQNAGLHGTIRRYTQDEITNNVLSIAKKMTPQQRHKTLQDMRVAGTKMVDSTKVDVVTKSCKLAAETHLSNLKESFFLAQAGVTDIDIQDENDFMAALSSMGARVGNLGDHRTDIRAKAYLASVSIMSSMALVDRNIRVAYKSQDRMGQAGSWLNAGVGTAPYAALLGKAAEEAMRYVASVIFKEPLTKARAEQIILEVTAKIEDSLDKQTEDLRYSSAQKKAVREDGDYFKMMLERGINYLQKELEVNAETA